MKIGLSKALLDSGDNVISKGFSAGPKASHKYWRRVRVMARGKLGWRYYYNTPEDRQRYLDDRKKKKHRGKHQKLTRKTKEQVDEMLHVSKKYWGEHFAEFSAPRLPLKDLTPKGIYAEIGWKAPLVDLDETAWRIANDLEASEEPADLWGKAMHPYRALEAAVKLLPEEIVKHFGGTVKHVDFYGKQADARRGKKHITKNWAAWATPALGKITLPLDTTKISQDRPESVDNYTFRGGNWPISVILHEKAHLFSKQLRRMAETPSFFPDYNGPTWNDWMALQKSFNGKGGSRSGEKGISDYAQTNMEERFCETFAAALLTPVQLAEQCPIAYDFMHSFMPSQLPTRENLLSVAYPADQIAKYVDPWFKSGAPEPTIAQTFIADLPEPDRAQEFYSLNPADPDKIGKQGKADRFYEMNYRGRTVYFRHGKPSPDNFDNWEPSTADKVGSMVQLSSGSWVGVKPKITALKEAYDELGNPIDPKYIYLHLIQDSIKDDTVIAVAKAGKPKKGQTHKKDETKEITMKYVRDHGGFDSDDPWISKIFGKSGGNTSITHILRGFANQTRTDELQAYQSLHAEREALSPSSKEFKEATEKLNKLRKEIEGRDVSQKARESGKSFRPVPATMAPVEITSTHFRQRSGAFNYDQWGMQGQELLSKIEAAPANSARENALIKEYQEKYPGTLALKDTRWPAGSVITDPKTGKKIKVGGRFRKGSPYFEVVNGKRILAMRKMVYENDNPDGSKTRVETLRGTDGRFRAKNKMWSALLTPNGEEIKSKEHLELLCRVAARNRHKTWVSVRTDRRRLRSKGKWTVEKSGDLEHNLHMEVEFDGAGQPRILGNKWAKKLGSSTPRVDMLLKKDQLGEVLSWAKDRMIIPAEPVVFKAEEERKSGLPSTPGDRVLLKTVTLDWKGKTDRGGRVVVARLLRKTEGKAAGEDPPEPGWDRMPEGYENMPREFTPGLSGRLTPKMKDFISRGLLPESFTNTQVQNDWYKNQFAPAHASWVKNFDEWKADSYDPVYIFAGETGMGGGSNIFTRVGDEAVAESVEWADSAPEPEALQNDVLAHHHKDIDPRTGSTISSEIRIIPPKDGSMSENQLLAVSGVKAHRDTKGGDITHFTTTLNAFPKVRASLGGLSLTGEVSELLDKRASMLKAAEKQRLAEAHELQIDQLDPTWLKNNFGAGLNTHLPNGRQFTLARHQSGGIQKLFDNDLRALLAHYMGTGKTVTALSACKAAMARPMRQGVEEGEGIPTDLVGEERAKWLADHPFVPGTLDPRNPTRCLIVAPLNTVEQWRQAASDFDEGALVVGAGANDIPIDELVDGIKNKTINPDLVVVGPQYFTIHAEKLKSCGFDGLVIDEVHQGIKNAAAERNKVVNSWNADMKMLCLLTGTPMTTSPVDFVEFVRLLSKGAQWATMDKKTFTEEFLMKTPIPGAVGAEGVSSPKIAIKPEKRAEFAAILAQWMDIALAQHVQGKIVPAVRIDETLNALMTGTQMDLYNLYMGKLNALGVSGGLTEEEADRLGGEAKKASNNAKGVMNCIGFKPGGDDPFLTISKQSVGKDGTVSTTQTAFETFNPEKLFSKDLRKKNAGRWPLLEELEGGAQARTILDVYCSEVLGRSYSELAGKRIGWGVSTAGVSDPFKPVPSKSQVDEVKRKMKEAGWPKRIENPDAGPMGIRFRGTSELWNKQLNDDIEKLLDKNGEPKKGKAQQVEALRAELKRRGSELLEAQEFQRAYRFELKYGKLATGEQESEEDVTPALILDRLASEWEMSTFKAHQLLALVPNPSTFQSTLEIDDKDYGKITLRSERNGNPAEGDQFVSDKRGSLHLLYRAEDIDPKTKLPKVPATTNFDEIRDGEVVYISPAILKKAGKDLDPNPAKKPTMPSGLTPDQKKAWKEGVADWTPPLARIDKSLPPDKKGNVAVIMAGQTVYVPKKAVKQQVKSLMEPGRRIDRLKADYMMCHGNAKAEAVKEHIEKFHDGSGAGPDGERQMVLFAGDILTGCRTLEAQLRLMGYRDVNETLEGSPLFDPEDKTTEGGVGPNGKYFVTYIGKTFTGDREQNTLIFKKVKDGLGRDSKTSLFVNYCMEPPAAATIQDKEGNKTAIDWQAYAGDTGNDYLPEGTSSVRMSQLSPEQRETARQTLGVKPPEAHVMRGNEKCYFYGSAVDEATRKMLQSELSTKAPIRNSSDILSIMARSPDPTKIKDSAKAEQARKNLQLLKKTYSRLASENATPDPPLSAKQIATFNNCELIICSDAAQVGMNLGNASEMLMYDSLGSPMAEWQRITRCARMLPEAVPQKLMGEPMMVPLMVPKRVDGVLVMSKDGKTPVMVESKAKNPETGKMETVLIQKRDESGRCVYKNPGVFERLRRQEPQLFNVEDRELPQGSIRGLSFGEKLQEGSDPTLDQSRRKAQNQERRKKIMTLDDALSGIAQSARAQAAIQPSKKLENQWNAIAAKAELAKNQGGDSARKMLEAFKETNAPESAEPLISFPAGYLKMADPEEGTYGRNSRGKKLLDTKDVERVVGEWFQKLDTIEQQEIMDSGFTKAVPPNVGSFDAREVYLAIRSQEILQWTDTMRPAVAAEMRAAEGGSAITDAEVENRLIDMLNPTDRAILKTKKYLVNVTKLGAAGAVGQVEKFGIGKDSSMVHTGYENEFPVKTEVRTRTLGRARMVSNEQIMADVQSGTEFKTDSDFEQISASDMSSVAVLKSLVPVFDMLKIDTEIVAKSREPTIAEIVAKSREPTIAETAPEWQNTTGQDFEDLDLVKAFKPSLKKSIRLGLPRSK